MYIDGSIRTYLDDLASDKPAPGGGSGAAFMGAAGAALLGMVGNFTVGKKKYKEVEAEIAAILKRIDSIRREMMSLVDEDVRGYAVIPAAYSMPKDTPEQKAARSAAIQEALKKAVAVPLRICRLAHEGLMLCPVLLAKGNENLRSDVGVGAVGLAAAYRGGLLNVEINLAQLKDADFVGRIRLETEPMTREAEKLAASVWSQTMSSIKGGAS